MSNFLESWLHIFVSNTKKNIDVDEDILELGAGTLNHLPYEKKFKVYDIVEPFYDLYKNSRYKTKISNFYDDISDIKGEKKYDRIISIAVLEHILDLPKVMATSSVLLKKDGVFSAGIPSEGSPIWYLGWRLSTGLEFFFRYKLNYGKILKYEHVNNAKEIENIARYFFQDVKIKRLGLNRFLSVYTGIECKSPNLKKVHLYLENKSILDI